MKSDLKSKLPKRDEDYDEKGQVVTLYHLTTKENFEKIKESGLIPQFGPHCKEFASRNYRFGGEPNVRVYLCEWTAVKHYHGCFPETEIIIGVDVRPNLHDKTIGYRYLDEIYPEYGIKTTIPTSQFKYVYEIINSEGDNFEVKEVDMDEG